MKSPSLRWGILLLAVVSGTAFAGPPKERSAGELLRQLHDSDASTRQWAALGLSKPALATDAVIQALLGALRDPEPVVRSAARFALREDGPQAAAALKAYDAARLKQWERSLSEPGYEDRQNLLVTFARGACQQGPGWGDAHLASCPAYELRFHGDGTLLYKGYTDVKTPGVKTDLLSDEAVKELLAAFERAGFLAMNDAYTDCPAAERRAVGDIVSCLRPTVTITLRLNGEEESVRHYTGDPSAPKALLELEDAVDRILGSKRWTQ